MYHTKENPKNSEMSETGNKIHEKNKGCSSHKMNDLCRADKFNCYKSSQIVYWSNKSVCGVSLQSC